MLATLSLVRTIEERAGTLESQPLGSSSNHLPASGFREWGCPVLAPAMRQPMVYFRATLQAGLRLELEHLSKPSH